MKPLLLLIVGGILGIAGYVAAPTVQERLEAMIPVDCEETPDKCFVDRGGNLVPMRGEE